MSTVIYSNLPHRVAVNGKWVSHLSPLNLLGGYLDANVMLTQEFDVRVSDSKSEVSAGGGEEV